MKNLIFFNGGRTWCPRVRLMISQSRDWCPSYALKYESNFYPEKKDRLPCLKDPSQLKAEKHKKYPSFAGSRATGKRTISYHRYWLKLSLDPLLWFLKALSNEYKPDVVLRLENQRSTFWAQAIRLMGPEAVDEMWEWPIVVWSNKKNGSIFDLDLEFWRTEVIGLIFGDIILLYIWSSKLISILIKVH